MKPQPSQASWGRVLGATPGTIHEQSSSAPCRIDDRDREAMVAMALAFYEEDPGLVTMTAEKVERTVQRLVQSPERGQLWFCRAGETIVGYAILIHFWSNEYGGEILHLDELYVQPAWRGQGAATAFLQFLAEVPQAGVVGVQIEVTPSNQKVLGFYQRLGFPLCQNTHLFRRL